MISGPQGDCKHTGHVGLDGAFFGDISFLGDKYHQLPKQVVTPCKFILSNLFRAQLGEIGAYQPLVKP